jgi:hypothetical protein
MNEDAVQADVNTVTSNNYQAEVVCDEHETLAADSSTFPVKK